MERSAAREVFSPEGWFWLDSADPRPGSLVGVVRAFAHLLLSGGCNRLLIGFDHTMDPDHIVDLAAGAAQRLGLDVRVADRPCPLPALAHACSSHAAGGLYFCASQATPERSHGLRFLLPGGSTTPSEVIQQIASKATRDNPASGTGEPVPRFDPLGPYLTQLGGLLDRSSLRRTRLRILIDPAGGVVDRLLERLLAEDLEKVNTIYGTPLRHFYHRRPLAIPSESLELGMQVGRGRWHAGLLLSGDGTGVGVVDEHGDWVPLDGLLATAGEFGLGEGLRLVAEDRLAQEVAEANEDRGNSGRVVRLRPPGRVSWGNTGPDGIAMGLRLVNWLAKGLQLSAAPHPHEFTVVIEPHTEAAVRLERFAQQLSEDWPLGGVSQLTRVSFAGTLWQVLCAWPQARVRLSAELSDAGTAILVRVRSEEREAGERTLRSVADALEM